MANDSKRVSQLGITTSVAANDRIVVLTNPGSATANLQSITVNNFNNYVKIANLNNGSNTLSFDANGVLNFPNGVKLGANIEGDNASFDMYAPATLNYMGLSYGSNASTGAASYLTLYKMGSDLNREHQLGIQVYRGTANGADGGLTGWQFNSNGSITYPDGTVDYGNTIIVPGNYDIQSISNTYIQTSASSGAKTWNFDTTGTVTFPDSSTQSTAFNLASAYTFTNVHTYSANVTINASVNVSTNTLTLGTSTKAANGYTYLPNGMKMNWGSFVCNTTSRITFSSAFATALVSLTVTPNGPYYVGANTPYIFASNTTTANIYSVSTTTTNTVYYVAIGY